MCVLDRARCAETNFTLRKVGRQVGCECDIETDVFSNFKHSNIFSHEKQLIAEQKKKEGKIFDLHQSQTGNESPPSV